MLIHSNNIYFNRKGLDARQMAFAVKKYKSHCCVGDLAEILEVIKAQERREKARGTF